MMKFENIKLQKILLLVLFVLNVCVTTNSFSKENELADVIKAAIFVEDNSNIKDSNIANELNDYITSNLTKAGFQIIDRKYVIDKFKDAKDENLEFKNALNQISEIKNFIQNEALDNTNTNVDATSLSLTKNMMADYLVIASISSFGKEEKVFRGNNFYKGNLKATDFTLRVSLKINNTKDGASVYADTVTVNKRFAENQNLQGASDSVIHDLLFEASQKIGEEVKKSISNIKERKETVSEKDLLTFKIECNEEGANAELDGFTLGAVPNAYKASKGIHTLKVSKDGYKTFEKSINIVSDDQVILVNLEYSQIGAKKHFAIENEKQNLKDREAVREIVKDKVNADIKNEEKIAEGEAEKRKNSYIKFKGDVDSLTIGDSKNTVINK